MFFLRENPHVRIQPQRKYVKKRQEVLEIIIVQFGSVRCSVRPYFSVVRYGSAEPLKRQFGRSLVVVINNVIWTQN